MEERIAIRDSARALKKYGSTSNYNCKRHNQFVKHQVKQSDTLQGLALKYSVTVSIVTRKKIVYDAKNYCIGGYSSCHGLIMIIRGDINISHILLEICSSILLIN